MIPYTPNPENPDLVQSLLVHSTDWPDVTQLLVHHNVNLKHQAAHSIFLQSISFLALTRSELPPNTHTTPKYDAFTYMPVCISLSLLLSRKPDPNHNPNSQPPQDEFGDTALHIAASKGFADVCCHTLTLTVTLILALLL